MTAALPDRVDSLVLLVYDGMDPSQISANSITESDHAESRQQAEEDWNWFLETNGSWDRRSTKNDRCEEAQLDPIWLSLLDAIASNSIL